MISTLQIKSQGTTMLISILSLTNHHPVQCLWTSLVFCIQFSVRLQTDDAICITAIFNWSYIYIGKSKYVIMTHQSDGGLIDCYVGHMGTVVATSCVSMQFMGRAATILWNRWCFCWWMWWMVVVRSHWPYFSLQRQIDLLTYGVLLF